ncbi:MAG: methionine synthase, partial [Myxococcales bacterium]|nr:methionine synthase [Myxococcales bacterium]
SLDEMVHVAEEMKRRGMVQPLLIGGATTSRQHTAVKIAPAYAPPVVHVLDASRAVNTVASLLSDEQRAGFAEANEKDQDQLRKLHARGPIRPLVPYAEANAKAPTLAFDDLPPPPFVGAREVEVTIAELEPYIDWTFFFTAWELKGRYPQILDDATYGPPARELLEHAMPLLERMKADPAIRARGVYGFWPARRDGNDILLEGEAGELRVPMLRQQRARDEGDHLCLADYVATQGDHVGAFAVTAGLGVGALVASLEKAHDDYSAILVKALADRLAEAFAELLHERVRRAWYAPDEDLSNEERIREQYRGIRPALGYPACPDHTDKRPLFERLGAFDIGMGLTETLAMTPAASVSGLYLAHPEARYFSVGKIGRDQVEDYARRRGVAVEVVEKALSTVLGY